jgi:hypothetical protein
VTNNGAHIYIWPIDFFNLKTKVFILGGSYNFLFTLLFGLRGF